jgi:hypothetical protein
MEYRILIFNLNRIRFYLFVFFFMFLTWAFCGPFAMAGRHEEMKQCSQHCHDLSEKSFKTTCEGIYRLPGRCICDNDSTVDCFNATCPCPPSPPLTDAQRSEAASINESKNRGRAECCPFKVGIPEGESLATCPQRVALPCAGNLLCTAVHAAYHSSRMIAGVAVAPVSMLTALPAGGLAACPCASASAAGYLAAHCFEASGHGQEFRPAPPIEEMNEDAGLAFRLGDIIHNAGPEVNNAQERPQAANWDRPPDPPSYQDAAAQAQGQGQGQGAGAGAELHAAAAH